MEWALLLPIFVSIGLSAAIFVLIYKIPPGWVSQQTAEINQSLQQLTSPSYAGDALHHAMTKNDNEVIQIASEYANGAIYDAIPVFSASLAKEGMSALAAMYSKGVASDMGKQSGAARGYLALPGIQKQVVKVGAESLLGGGLEGILGNIPPEVIQGFLSSMTGAGAGNGQQSQSALPAPSQSQQQYQPVVMPHG